MFEKCCAKCKKVRAATPLFVRECINLQFHNSDFSYSLSAVKFLEEQLQTFAFAMVTFGTTTFSKELLFQSTYSLNFLLWNCSFWEQLLLRGSIWSIKFFFCLILIRSFQNSPKKLHINSGSEKITSPRFHGVSFVCK